MGQNSATLTGYASGNGNNINTWIEYPCYGSQYGIQNNVSSANLSATVYSLSPNTTYSYCAVAQNQTGGQIIRGNVVYFTTSSYYTPPASPVYVAPTTVTTSTSAITTVATNVSQNSAELNGLLMNTTSYASNTYFEYGTTTNLGTRTDSKNVGTGTNINFSNIINNLSQNTIYYFRANVENPNGVARGKIEIFQTLGRGVKPVVVTGRTKVGTESPIMLKIEDKYESIGVGDIVDYTVTYKNIGTNKLTRPMIQVILPKGITFTNASKGTYADDTRTLSVPLDTLNPKDSGVIYLQGRVDTLEPDATQIISTALLVYTNPNDSQENAIAYVINKPKTNGVAAPTNSLGAAVGFFGLWLPGTLLGWLFWIIIILLILLLIRLLFGKKKDKENNAHPVH